MAPHVLSLQIGATNIPLSATDALLLDYVPQTAALSATGQGTEIYESERQLVTESVRLWLYAATGALVQAKIASIERFIEEAARRQRTRTGDRGYLYIQMSSDTESWRSEIVSARLQAGDDGLRHWANNGVEVLLIVTRRPFWEAVAEVELPLDNGSGGGKATGGCTIYNHDDAGSGHDNWVDVAAVDVAGNLPSPLRITLKDLSGSFFPRTFWQASNVFSSPSTFGHILEGEAAGGANSTADAYSSGGYFGRAPWTTEIVHSVNLFRWDLSTSLLAAAAGNYFRVLCRFANSPPSGIELQLHLKFPTGTPLATLWSGSKFIASAHLLQDLGVVQLPPGIPSSSHDGVALVLSAEYTGTSQLDIDFVQLSPAESTRLLRQVGYQLEINDLVVNDGPEGRVYAVDDGSAVQWNIFEAYNNALFIWPNRAQRLYFLHDETASMTIARAWSVRAYYRPRRSTL